MKIWALIKKELHANYAFASFGLLGSLILTSLFWSHPDPDSYRVFTDLWMSASIPSAVVVEQYLGYFQVLCYGVMLTLGLLLSLQERVRKTWEFLTHRPVSRFQILASKLLAGLLLEILVLGIPYGLLVFRALFTNAYPAPWSWSYILPGMEILLQGFVLFQGGILCEMQNRGRFYILRFFLILIFSIVGILYSVMSNSWMVSFVTLGIVLLIQFFALTHIFLGWNKTKVVSIFTLTLGSTISSLFLWLLVVGSLEEDLQIYSENYRWASPVWQLNGEAGLLQRGEGEREVELVSLDEKLVVNNLAAGDKPYLPSVFFHQGLYDNSYPYYTPILKRRKMYRIELFDLPRMGFLEFIRPYFSYDEGLFILYDDQKKEVFGYWGRNGFYPDKRDVKAFGSSYNVRISGVRAGNAMRYYLIFPNGIYELDYKTRTTKTIFEGSIQNSLLYFNFTPKLKQGENLEKFEEHPPLHVIRSQDKLIFLKENGEIYREYKLSKHLQKLDVFQVALLPGKILGAIEDSRFAPDIPKENYTVKMYKIDQDSKIIWEKGLNLPSYSFEISRIDLRFFGPGVAPMFCSFIWCIQPNILNLIHEYIPPSKINNFLLILLVKWIVVALLAQIIFSHRGFSAAERLGWTCYAFITGIPGLFVLWMVFGEEKFLPCPECKAKRIPSGLSCPQCHKPWPKPEPREIDLVLSN